ncbi:uncharacterized protein LOC123314102 [Coccinella septempunctata]|uniref:uncharacterized protein LOC123314102 n=1 Tax=Coccinella septempunctata TaxID=41139 RepID=UPI001D09439F|nr:uncharacterized protein LOC123314102 [Coccinella septempunctata]
MKLPVYGKGCNLKNLQLLWLYDYYKVFATSFYGSHVYLLTYNGFKNFYEKIESADYSSTRLIEKTGDLNQNQINVLFTFNDHTKIRKVKDYEGKTEKYEGKDYDIIKTIFENLNADFRVIDIDDTISDPTGNPWFTNLDMENKSEIQRDILKRWNITMLTKSQRILENDGVIEVTYPHTENAIALLLPKCRKITKPEEVYDYVTQPIWYLHFTLLVASIMAQAKITSMLSTDLYENELDSLEDIYRKEKLDFIIFGLNSYVDEIAEKYEGSKYMNIIEGMVKVPMDENLGELMLLEMPKPTTFKMAIMLEYDIAKFYARHIKNRADGGGRPYLHLMKHSLMPCFQAFHVTAGSPLFSIIDKKIKQLVEGGFIVLFKRRFLFKGLIDGYLYPDEDSDVDVYEPAPISMDLAKYVFLLLFIGLTISAISFIAEILLHNVKNIIFICCLI